MKSRMYIGSYLKGFVVSIRNVRDNEGVEATEALIGWQWARAWHEGDGEYYVEL
jgi:hypothetical protein